jgi:hypothetical protein
MSEEGNGNAAGEGGETPWYESLKPAAEDLPTYQKYKTQEDALRALPHQQRLLGKAIQIPSSDKPAEIEAAHREILTKLGAPKEAKAYGLEEMLKDVPQAIRDNTPPEVLKVMAEDALDLGLLPWQMKRAWQRQLERAQAHLAAKPERDRAAEVERINAKTEVLGPKYELAIKDGEAAAARLDNDLLAEQNSKLSADDLAQKGGVLMQALKKADDPVLWRAFQHIHDRLYAESGSPATPNVPGNADGSAYQGHYNAAKQMWPKRGESFWHNYAKEKAGAR